MINSRYFPSAGPERYLFNISEVLGAKGHEVIPFSLQNSRNAATPYASYFAENVGGDDELYYEGMQPSIKVWLQLTERQFYSVHVKRRLEKLIDNVNPDIAYILHYQNRLSPSVIAACKGRRVPVVLRISDFSTVCTRNTLSRNGKVCELCLERGLHQGVLNRCVKGSVLASAVKAAALKYHRLSRIYEKADRVIVPSEFTISKLVSVLNQEKMKFLPTLVLPQEKCWDKLGNYALFVGRVEEEKGLKCAIDAFAYTPYILKIAGFSHSGYGEELQRYAAHRGIQNVEFLGPVYGKDLDVLYQNCRFVLLPVIWYENLPNVALEGMAHGKPLVGSDIGSMKEVILHKYNGLLFNAGDSASCLEAVQSLFENDDLCRALGRAAHRKAEEYYSTERHYAGLISIFSEVIHEVKSGKSPSA